MSVLVKHEGLYMFSLFHYYCYEKLIQENTNSDSDFLNKLRFLVIGLNCLKICVTFDNIRSQHVFGYSLHMFVGKTS